MAEAVQCKLDAILAADVVDHSRLIADVKNLVRISDQHLCERRAEGC